MSYAYNWILNTKLFHPSTQKRPSPKWNVTTGPASIVYMTLTDFRGCDRACCVQWKGQSVLIRDVCGMAGQGKKGLHFTVTTLAYWVQLPFTGTVCVCVRARASENYGICLETCRRSFKQTKRRQEMKEGDFYSKDEEPQHGRRAQGSQLQLLLVAEEEMRTKKKKLGFKCRPVIPFMFSCESFLSNCPCMFFVGVWWNHEEERRRETDWNAVQTCKIDVPISTRNTTKKCTTGEYITNIYHLYPATCGT